MILVTGGTGLLGSHLLLHLTMNGQEVKALYRDKKRLECVRKVFHYYQNNLSEVFFSKIIWIQGDILDLTSLEEAMNGVTDVYHCAGLVSFSSGDFKKVMKVNREGTANVVNCCLAFNIRKLCHVSSTAAVGQKENGLTNESVFWKKGPETSGYSVSKYGAEQEVWRGIEEGLNAVIVNPSVIFGAGNWEESSMTIFKLIENGLRFYTPGANGYVDARDVAEIMIRLMDSEIKSERFLCVGVNSTFKELLTLIAQKMNKRPPSIGTPRWMAELGWRTAALFSFLQGTTPKITRENVASAYKHISYDSTKVRERLNFDFRKADETIENALKGRIS
jgi:dihydroflavonol-4-reductase